MTPEDEKRLERIKTNLAGGVYAPWPDTIEFLLAQLTAAREEIARLKDGRDTLFRLNHDLRKEIERLRTVLSETYRSAEQRRIEASSVARGNEALQAALDRERSKVIELQRELAEVWRASRGSEF